MKKTKMKKKTDSTAEKREIAKAASLKCKGFVAQGKSIDGRWE